MNTVFLIDFDNTLFDTAELKKAIYDKAAELFKDGLEENENWFREQYDASRIKDNGGVNIAQFVKTLAEKTNKSEKDIWTIFKDHEFPELLLDGAEEFLEKAADVGRVIIFTDGDDYQRTKMEKCGLLKEEGSRLEIEIHDNKINELHKKFKELEKGTRVVMADDKQEILMRARKIAEDLGLEFVGIRVTHGIYVEQETIEDFIEVTTPKEATQVLIEHNIFHPEGNLANPENLG